MVNIGVNERTVTRMAEYIERKALREAFENADADVVEEYEDGTCDWGFGHKNILEVINSVPAADVAPVRHGRWIECIEIGAMNNHYECSACHWKTPSFTIARDSNFCPNCGAKMDLEV